MLETLEFFEICHDSYESLNFLPYLTLSMQYIILILLTGCFYLCVLRESLEPMLEKYNITFESHSVFLDSSNTPLPLAFETFPLSGSILHVRGMSAPSLFFYIFIIFETLCCPEIFFGERSRRTLVRVKLYKNYLDSKETICL